MLLESLYLFTSKECYGNRELIKKGLTFPLFEKEAKDYIILKEEQEQSEDNGEGGFDPNDLNFDLLNPDASNFAELAEKFLNAAMQLDSLDNFDDAQSNRYAFLPECLQEENKSQEAAGENNQNQNSQCLNAESSDKVNGAEDLRNSTAELTTADSNRISGNRRRNYFNR